MNLVQSRLCFGLISILVAGAVIADPLTLQQIVDLKRMGFSDQDVAAEAVKTDSRIDLTEHETYQLRSAGAGDLLIDALAKLAKKVTIPDVLAMVHSQQSLEQIVARIVNSYPRTTLTVEETQSLMSQQVPVAIIVALDGKRLGPPQLIMLAEAKTPPAVVAKLADATGLEPVKTTTELTKSMTEAGVPAEILERMEKAAQRAAAARDKPYAEAVALLLTKFADPVRAAADRAPFFLIEDNRGKRTASVQGYDTEAGWWRIANMPEGGIFLGMLKVTQQSRDEQSRGSINFAHLQVGGEDRYYHVISAVNNSLTGAWDVTLETSAYVVPRVPAVAASDSEAVKAQIQAQIDANNRVLRGVFHLKPTTGPEPGSGQRGAASVRDVLRGGNILPHGESWGQ